MGCLIYLAGFFIPILPSLIVSGYSAILIRQVLNGEKPHLVQWENWEVLLKDGAKLFGIRLVYSSPLLILIILVFLIFFAFSFFSILVQIDDSQGTGIASFIFFLVVTGVSLLIVPVSLAIRLIVPIAEVHVIAQDDFMAGFRLKEWWPIFKKNWGGFVVALAIMYALLMVMSFAMQIMFFTIVLICLLPLFIPAIYMYYAVVQYVVFTQAYKDGKDSVYMEASTT